MLTRLCLTALSWIQFSGAQLIVEQTAAGGVYLSGALDLDLASYTNCYVSLRASSHTFSTVLVMHDALPYPTLS